ncbi:MAG: endonuclease/exonuclease/phosphatase family protein [Candidatus Saccharimonadales bacterium]
MASELDGDVYAASTQKLRSEGYRIALANISDQPGVRSNHGIAMLVRKDLHPSQLSSVTTGERNGFATRLLKDGVEWGVGGVLLPEYSTDARVQGVFDMHRALKGPQAAVMMGDFNDMHSHSLRATIARAVRRIEQATPGEATDYYNSRRTRARTGFSATSWRYGRGACNYHHAWSWLPMC